MLFLKKVNRFYKIPLLVQLAIGLTITTTTLLVAVAGQDEFMTCSRPTKSSRSSKQISLPCDGMEMGKESWCSLPGPMYPWHAVRNFVFENQGLMRRMYGEVRQLSLLRMEFSGENNAIEPEISGREFDDIFKPITTTHSFGPTPATTSSLVNILSTANTYVVHDDEIEYEEEASRESADSSDININSPSSSTTSSSLPNSLQTSSSASLSTEPSSSSLLKDLSSSSSELNDDSSINNVSDGSVSSEIDKLTTLTQDNPNDDATTTHFVDGLIDTVPTEEVLTTIPTEEPDKDDDAETFVVIIQQNNVSSSNTKQEKVQDNNNEKNSEPTSEEEKNRLENHVLFQDYEKSNNPSSPSPMTTPRPPPASTEEPRVRSRIGVNACPVKEEVVAPYWANNTRGEILALLNLYPFEQYIHWEKCTNEHRQMYCRDGCRCEQQYRLHRLLAFDPSNECRGIFSDWFRFPSCCVCKCYFEDTPSNERISFNRSPRIFDTNNNDAHHPLNLQDLDGPDVNGVDDSHFFYKYHHSFRQPRK